MTSYSVKMTPAEFAEQSRIATAQGMRDIANAMAAEESYSSDASESTCYSSCDEARKRKRKSKSDKKEKKTKIDDDYETRAHYLKLELVNCSVDLENAKEEIIKLKTTLDPYASFNNEMAFLKSSIERSNKELPQLTLTQIEKRLSLFKEEYSEHAVLCSAAISKILLAEVNSAFNRVLVVEKRRALNSVKSLEWVIFVRKTTINTVKATIVTSLVVLVFVILYWYFLSHLTFKMPKIYINPRLL